MKNQKQSVRSNPFQNIMTIVGLSMSLLLFSTYLPAQLLEEVIVTAQKREQSLQDVGISVTAFSGEQ